MKKFGFYLLILISIMSVFFASSASAATLTAEQVNSIVQMLQSFGVDTSVISKVQSVLAENGGGSISSWCHSFEKDLKFGDSNSEVANLVLVLNKEGLLSGKTDNFNEEVAAAVVKLQARYGVLQTGYFGPLTRGKINSIHGCVKPAAEIKVVSPNGGEALKLSTKQSITWKSPSSSAVDIYLVRNQSGCFNLKAGMACLGVVDPIFKIASGIQGGTYNWTVGDFTSADYGSTIEPGRYYLKICLTDSKKNVCDKSDEQFTITNGSVTDTIKVSSPNGGEYWQQGNQRIISWADSSYSCSPGTPCAVPGYDIKLSVYYPPCSGQVCPMMAVRMPYTIAKNVAPEYSWVVGNVIDGGTVNDGYYTITVCRSGTTFCGSSQKFSIGQTASANKPPVIDGGTFPSRLKVGETGTWVIKAHDPEGGSLSYSVDWGDVPPPMTPMGVAASPSLSQSSTFTHGYSWTGTFTLRIKVIDSAGLSAETSSTVEVVS
jgi:peptidoglycan hydrolase-like protein with peptidoglycan-binding domain